MSPVGKPGAIVGSENDESNLVETVGADRVENLSDGPVNLSDDVAVDAILGGAGKAITGEEWDVGLRMRHVKEKRFGAIAIDKVDGAGGQPGGGRSARQRRSARAVGPAVYKTIIKIYIVFSICFFLYSILLNKTTRKYIEVRA